MSLAEQIKKRNAEKRRAESVGSQLDQLVEAPIGETVKPITTNIVVPVASKKAGRPAGANNRNNAVLLSARVEPEFAQNLEIEFIRYKDQFVTKGVFFGELLKLGLKTFKEKQ